MNPTTRSFIKPPPASALSGSRPRRVAKTVINHKKARPIGRALESFVAERQLAPASSHRADSGVQTALVASGLVAVNEAFASGLVQRRDRIFIGGFGGGFVAGSNRVNDFFDLGTERRASAGVVGPALGILADPLPGRYCMCQGTSPVIQSDRRQRQRAKNSAPLSICDRCESSNKVAVIRWIESAFGLSSCG